MAVDVEDIFNDSLQFFGESAVADDEGSVVQYGEIILAIPPKEGKAISLLADQLFSPSLLLAEYIETGKICLQGKTVLELGAGCALPCIVASMLPESSIPSLVVATDYPDPIIMNALEKNVAMNRDVAPAQCDIRIRCMAYEWGTDTTALKDLLPPSATPGYDALILSDLLYFSSSHDIIISSMTSLLARAPQARVYVAAGTYTPPPVCDYFIRESSKLGMWWKEGPHDEEWVGERVVKGLTVEDMGRRKGMCRWWIGGWVV